MFATLDWKAPEFYHYLAIAGAVVAVLSVAVYAVPGSKLKVPGVILGILGGVALGAAAGVIFMGWVGYQLTEPPPAMPNGPPPGMGGMNGVFAARGSSADLAAAFGSNPKNRLANLVSKLDVLSEKPLTARLSDEQKKQVEDQLKGLADADELTEDAAKAKLDKLHETLKGQKEALEAVGYRWPEGEGGGGRGTGFGGPMGGAGPPPANPFKSGPNADHLKAVNERLRKGEKG
jgi:hypothetical protein